jgi:hypothetical protein
MSGLQVQFHPEVGGYSIKDLDSLLYALETRIKAREVMHRKEAAEFIGISLRQLDELTSQGSIPCHRLEGLSSKLYLRSELLDRIRNSKL